MSRYLSWLANAALFVACCFLLANTANTVFASLLTPGPTDLPPEPSRPAAGSGPDWKQREVILTRNLFNASLLAPTEPVVDELEDLERTRLPLNLLGTVAGDNPARAWAAVQDLTARKTEVVRNGDELRGGEAKVLRIERRRIVLLEKGATRELALDDEKDTAGNGRKSAVSARAAPGREARLRRPARQAARRERLQPTPSPERGEPAVRSAASIFSQAQFQPRYESGEMIGMQVNSIKPGSELSEIGLVNGDVIVELNGIAIDGPESSGEIMNEFNEALDFTIVVEGPAGSRTLSYTRPEE